MSQAEQSAPPVFGLAPGFCMIPPVPSIEIICAEAGPAGLTLAVTDAVAADVAPDATVTTYTMAAGWRGLLVLDRVALRVTQGHGKWRRADSAALAKLQAFLDTGLQPDGVTAGSTDAGARAAVCHANGGPGTQAASAQGPMLTVLPATGDTAGARLLVDGKRRALEHWFLTQPAAPHSDFDSLGTTLRRTEWYRLVRFLLVQPASLSMQQLSKRYGLSYSYFRLLCRQALGRGGKAEFQHWRNVRALLDMVDSGGKLTDVALRQGFASSSHFSDAMKGQFGMSPRELTRMLTPK